MGIVYAPDYVINAGGVINVADELYGYNRERALKRVESIYDTIAKVIEISKRDGIATYVAADRLAEERIASLKTLVAHTYATVTTLLAVANHSYITFTKGVVTSYEVSTSFEFISGGSNSVCKSNSCY